MAKSAQVTLINNTRGDITLVAPPVKNEESGQMQFQPVKYVRTERDKKKVEHEGGEILIFGVTKAEPFSRYPVTLDKAVWDKMEQNIVIKGLIDQGKLDVR